MNNLRMPRRSETSSEPVPDGIQEECGAGLRRGEQVQAEQTQSTLGLPTTPHGLVKYLLKECTHCDASVREGVLWLEAGDSFDLSKILNAESPTIGNMVSLEQSIQTLCASVSREFILARIKAGAPTDEATTTAWNLALMAREEFPERGTESSSYIRLETMAKWGVINTQEMYQEFNDYRYGSCDGDPVD